MSYAAAWYKMTHFAFSDAIAVIRYEIFFHTPRLTESVTKINLAYSNDCYTRFASPHNVQSRADTVLGIQELRRKSHRNEPFAKLKPIPLRI